MESINQVAPSALFTYVKFVFLFLFLHTSSFFKGKEQAAHITVYLQCDLHLYVSSLAWVCRCRTAFGHLWANDIHIEREIDR